VILAHSELEAMYAYLGMVLQGEMIRALFTGLKPLVFLLLIIGIVWAIGSMMVRGRANAILLYILLAVASLVLLKQTMVADSQALITGKSGSTIANANSAARVNTIFFAVVRSFDAVLSSLINILDRGFGKNVAFANAPFASTRGMMWAMAQTMDDAETIREAGKFLSQCLGPAEARLQNSNQKGSISGIFGGLGDLVNRPNDQAAANTRAALQEIIPVDGPATCLEWATQIKSRFGTWLDNRKTLLTDKLTQLSDAQANDVLTLALFTAATRLYNGYQSQGAGQGLVPESGGTGGGEEERRASLFERASQWLGGAAGTLVSLLGGGIVDFVRGFMQTIVPTIQGWLIMLLYGFFPFGVVLSLLPGMHARVIDYFGAIWWVKSWTLFLGLISHLLEALYGVSGGFTLTDDFAMAGTGLVNLTNNVAWAYLFLVILTPFISYTLFFGKLGNLASLRFRFVGLNTLTRVGSRVVG
jgi:TraG-like protein, N-terminal region